MAKKIPSWSRILSTTRKTRCRWGERTVWTRFMEHLLCKGDRLPGGGPLSHMRKGAAGGIPPGNLRQPPACPVFHFTTTFSFPSSASSSWMRASWSRHLVPRRRLVSAK